jgi:hypothetical protein
MNHDINNQHKPMKTKVKSAPKIEPSITAPELGANQKETVVQPVKRDANFKQSRDVREDRSQRQAKNTAPTSAKKGK